MTQHREWLNQAMQTIEADYNRSADTHLIPVHLAAYPNIDFYLKDESSHPTGSLKHRLARSLFMYALANGWLREGSTVIEASSGSTAVSEAYFARLLKLPFIAVMPESTSKEKIAAIEFYGGQCHFVSNPSQISAKSKELVIETGGHFMDQFTYAERATDWRANNNIAESIFNQMALERFPIPHWIVASCGTGGTSATLGRYVRYRRLASGIACVDPENSVFFDAYHSTHRNHMLETGSRIEGIGRPRVEESFIPSVIDRMLQIPDNLSLAAAHWLSAKIGKKVGGSTGCNWVGALQLAQEMQAQGQAGSIVTLLCDSGERYAQTYFSATWLAANGFDLSDAKQQIVASCELGHPLPALREKR
ncbi:PLP-dependent cysteine synthase family protein [Chitinibacter sp. SCUT-21]|uniref:PLP-dependent cysteine synthase family protein n=1 Tax=Chitinibacter sp. SCUT-21 TaxID=2970891 RepID=UPI0035A68CA1